MVRKISLIMLVITLISHISVDIYVVYDYQMQSIQQRALITKQAIVIDSLQHQLYNKSIANYHQKIKE